MYFGMRPQISVDADSRLMHTMRGKSGNVPEVTLGSSLLYGEKC